MKNNILIKRKKILRRLRRASLFFSGLACLLILPSIVVFIWFDFIVGLKLVVTALVSLFFYKVTKKVKKDVEHGEIARLVEQKLREEQSK